jgi:hypothetical protein
MILMRPWIAAATVSLAALAHAQEVPTIRVPVRLVTCPTLVFSAEGKLVPGLSAADFRVFDNGHLQKIDLDTGSRPLSIALAVQVNRDVRSYVPFIAKTGSIVDALLAGESSESAVIAYSKRYRSRQTIRRRGCSIGPQAHFRRRQAGADDRRRALRH